MGSRGCVIMGGGAIEISVLSGNLVLSSASSTWPGISVHPLKGFLRILISGCPSLLWYFWSSSCDANGTQVEWQWTKVTPTVLPLMLCKEGRLRSLSSSGLQGSHPHLTWPSFHLRNPHSLEKSWIQNCLLNGIYFIVFFPFKESTGTTPNIDIRSAFKRR